MYKTTNLKKHPKGSKYKSRTGSQLKTRMLKKESKHRIKYCDGNTAYIKSESEEESFESFSTVPVLVLQSSLLP